MANDTTVKIKLDLDADRFKQEAKELESLKFVEMTDELRDGIEDAFAKQLQYNEEVKKLKQLIKEINEAESYAGLTDKDRKNLAELREGYQMQLDELQKPKKEAKARKEFAETLKDKGKKVLSDALSNIKKFGEDVLDIAKKMMNDIASYSENSLIYSQEATDLRLSYGLSGAQAYAYQKAAEDVGFNDFEDYLNNQWAASNETLERMQDLVEAYEKTYEEDKVIAEEYQKFQTEWQDFKKEVGMSLIDFFMNNKDSIMLAIETTVDILSSIMEFVGWLVDRFNAGRDRTSAERTKDLSDIYNSYGASKTTNIKIDNSFQGISPNDRKAYQDAADMTYRQIIDANI